LLAVGGGTAIYETQQNPTTDGPVELRARWIVGKKYELHSEVTQRGEIKSPGQPKPVEEGLNWTQDCNVSALKKLPAGGWQLELEFVNEAMDESQAGHNVSSFDSAQSRAVDAHNPWTILGALVGVRLGYFTDAVGKVQTVEGMSQLTDHIAAVGTPDQRNIFYQLFGGNQLKGYLSCGDWLPNRMMNVGESWSVKNDITNSLGTVTVTMKYTFKNWEPHGDHKCAHYEGTGDVLSKSVSTASGSMVKIEKDALSEEFWFDPELGMITAGNENEDYIYKITTRTQTVTKEAHNKSHWTLVDAQ
jgi:hypothetical protein